jgi:5-methylcytosine-specific restriction endonuclease McrA
MRSVTEVRHSLLWLPYCKSMANPRSRQVRAAKKRKRRMHAADNDLTPEQWAEIELAWGTCAYCGQTSEALSRDCIQPISRGGRYTLDNVVPACKSCNSSKSNSEVTLWMRRKKLDEKKFLVRHYEIQQVLAKKVEFAAIKSHD